MTRKWKYYYLCFNDKKFGWIFVKIQSWFPFMTQIYSNGREWLSKVLDKNNIKYIKYNNCFVDIEDITKAQELADKLTDDSLGLYSSLEGIIKKINIYLPKIIETFGTGYHWCLDVCEYAIDIMFNSRNDLEDIYSSLVEHSFFSFKCEDIMSFFGRKVSGKIMSKVLYFMNKDLALIKS